jgi:hypothetical protein
VRFVRTRSKGVQDERGDLRAGLDRSEGERRQSFARPNRQDVALEATRESVEEYALGAAHASGRNDFESASHSISRRA